MSQLSHYLLHFLCPISQSSSILFIFQPSHQNLSVIPNIKDIIDCILYIISSMIPYLFQQDQVSLNNGHWTEEASLQVSSITQSPASVLSLYGNQRVTLVKEIAHIHFTHLTRLFLGGNRIESVEGLARVQMAHIQQVMLWENKITSVRVLRKAAWPCLSELLMEQNYFGDANTLVHGYFPQMELLFVYSAFDKNGFTESCFSAKMQAASMKSLSIRGEHEVCLNRVLKKRWPDIEIE